MNRRRALGTRRRFLLLGTAGIASGLTGCSTRDADEEPGTAPNTTGATATFVVEQREGDSRCIDPRTGELLASAPVGEEDARVIQAAFDALQDRGLHGSVFVRNGVYEITDSFGSARGGDSGLSVVTDRTQVRSDFATLRFGHHTDVDIQKDFKLYGLRDVLLSGLVLDGDRSNRTTMTVTLQVSECENVTVRGCVIHGGSAGDREERGYGVAPNRNDGFVLENCLVRDADRHGIHPGGQPGAPNEKTRVSNCTFRDNGVLPSGSAVDVRSNTTDTIVENCVFEGNGRAVKVKGSSVDNVQLRGNVFRDNVFPAETGDLAQVMLRPEEGFTTIGVHDNQFALSEGHAGRTAHVLTVFEAGGETVELRNNDFRGGDVAVSGEGDAPIESLVVVGNTVEGQGPTLAEFRQAEHLVLSGNTFESSADRADVVVDESIESGLVTENVLVGSRFRGLDERLESNDNVVE